MRVIKEIPNSNCKITIFAWNQKFLIKFEQGLCEQTFKVSQLEVPNVGDIEAQLTEPFLTGIIKRFEEMHAALYPALLEQQC